MSTRSTPASRGDRAAWRRGSRPSLQSGGTGRSAATSGAPAGERAVGGEVERDARRVGGVRDRADRRARRARTAATSTPSRHAIDGRRRRPPAARRVALDRAGGVEQLEARAVLGGRGRGDLADERGDGLAARLEERAELAAEQRRRPPRARARPVAGAPSPANARSTSCAGPAPELRRVGAVPPRALEAVRAEAEAEQQARRRAELDEVALVVGAVLERVVVQRLGEHRARRRARRCRRASATRVGADVRVGRAQLGQAADRRSTVCSAKRGSPSSVQSTCRKTVQALHAEAARAAPRRRARASGSASAASRLGARLQRQARASARDRAGRRSRRPAGSAAGACVRAGRGRARRGRRRPSSRRRARRGPGSSSSAVARPSSARSLAKQKADVLTPRRTSRRAPAPRRS